MNYHRKKHVSKSYIFISFFLKTILILAVFIAAWKQDWLWGFFSVIMVLLSFIPFLINYYYKFIIPCVFDLLITIAFLLHTGDGLFDICYSFPLYNKITHFFSAVVVACIVYLSLIVVNNFENSKINVYKLSFDVVVITIAFGVLWEFMEWGTDTFFGLNTQPSLGDTMDDLLADSLGGLFVAIIGFFIIKKKKFVKFLKNLKEEVDDIIDDD